MRERPNRHAWKACEAQASVGSNPTPSARVVKRGSISGMPDATTIKVSIRTRDALRQLAERDGLTLDAQLDLLIRRERRRVIGLQLASGPLDLDERAVLDASARDIADACG